MQGHNLEVQNAKYVLIVNSPFTANFAYYRQFFPSIAALTFYLKELAAFNPDFNVENFTLYELSQVPMPVVPCTAPPRKEPTSPPLLGDSEPLSSNDVSPQIFNMLKHFDLIQSTLAPFKELPEEEFRNLIEDLSKD